MNASRDVTIYDLAKALKLSPATVSRGLKNHPAVKKVTRVRILDMAKVMGYQRNQFARNLRVRHTNTIGVIVPRLDSYVMSAIISGMEKVAQARGYSLLISQSQESAEKEQSNVRTMFNSRVDGLLLSLSSNTEDLSHLDAFFQKRIPVILFDRVVRHPLSTSISIDNVRAGYDVTRHLIEQGCSRIVHIGGSIKRDVYSDRLEGYRAALQESGMIIDNSLVFHNELKEDDGINVARAILELDPMPDGIFASNDTTAAACIKILKENGLSIPGDIAVAGFNEDPVSRVIEPQLTTIHYPGLDMGELAARTMIDAIRGQHSASLNNLILRHQLVVRNSTLRHSNQN